MRTSRGMQKAKELRRFLLYSLYAWGVAGLLTALTMLFDVYAWLPDDWNPDLITENHCWFQSINNRALLFCTLAISNIHHFVFVLTDSFSRRRESTIRSTGVFPVANGTAHRYECGAVCADRASL